MSATGIKITAGGNILDALRAYKPMVGMEGATYYYYYTNPKNKINDWLVSEHEKRFNGAPPDFFTCGGFAAAMAVVAAIKKADSTDTEKLIAAMEGMKFDTPQGRDDVPQGPTIRPCRTCSTSASRTTPSCLGAPSASWWR